MAERFTPPRRENRGFTLIEMLLVVAIIAILVAVSIPALNGTLERARCATDAANERAARTAVLAKWATGEYGPNDNVNKDNELCKWCEYKYDAATGKVYKSKESQDISAYGKCTACQGGRVVVFVCPKCGQTYTMWKPAKSDTPDPLDPSKNPLPSNWHRTHGNTAEAPVDIAKQINDHATACGLTGK